MDSDEDWDPTILKGYMVGKCGNSIMCTNFDVIKYLFLRN